ncbi:MAG: hypothetical protein ACREP8_16365, partial [Candidatus Binatia bacterium]
MEAQNKPRGNSGTEPSPNNSQLSDNRPENFETQKWLDSLGYVLNHIFKHEESERASLLLDELIERLRGSGIKIPYTVNTPYLNTIA